MLLPSCDKFSCQSLDIGFSITNPALAAKSPCKYMLQAVVHV